MKTIFRVLAILSLLFTGLGIYQPVAGAPAFQDGSPPEPGPNVFLPLLSLNARAGNLVTYTGQVLDEANKPVAAVTVVDEQGRQVVTDAKGQYTITGQKDAPLELAAIKSGYTFMPSMLSVQPSSAQSITLEPILAVAACQEKVANGSFANTTVDPWKLVVTAQTARLQTNFGHTDTRSALTGIQTNEKNLYSYSDLYQELTIPSGIDSAVLRLWIYPVSANTTQEPIPERFETSGPDSVQSPNAVAWGEAALAGDVQYVLILDVYGNILDTLLWTRSDSRTWTLYEYSLARYAGRKIRLQIGSYNDGAGGVTSMNVDDVSLTVCDTGGGSTGGCTNYFDNSGFEFDSGWSIPATRYSAGYSTARASAGSRSMRTGITAAADNTFSYSDAYQLATIPSGVTRVTLNMAVFLQTAETTTTSLAGPERASQSALFGTEALAEDAQYVLVLNNAGYILEYLYWTRSNSAAWTQLSFDLTPYRGSTIRIQFGSFNNGAGGVTSMFVDQAFLDVCTGGVSPTPMPTTVPPMPTPSPTPVPTPVPGSCSEAVLNGGFETDSAWIVPLTEFTAGYSTRQVHSGTRSMRSGIIFTAHDRFSYSDLRQQVMLPEDSASATLTAWVYQESEDLTGQDKQYILLLNQYGYWIDTLYMDLENVQGWVQKTFDLSDYISGTRDVTLGIHFGTFNDGLNGVSSMFVDDVSLRVCMP